MTKDPLNAVNKPVSIHDYALENGAKELGVLRDSVRQETVRTWVNDTLGKQLLSGISLEAPNLAGDSGGDSPKNFALSRLTEILGKAGFEKVDISSYIGTIKETSEVKAKHDIQQAITPQIKRGV